MQRISRDNKNLPVPVETLFLIQKPALAVISHLALSDLLNLLITSKTMQILVEQTQQTLISKVREINDAKKTINPVSKWIAEKPLHTFEENYGINYEGGCSVGLTVGIVCGFTIGLILGVTFPQYMLVTTFGGTGSGAVIGTTAATLYQKASFFYKDRLKTINHLQEEIKEQLESSPLLPR